MIKLTSSDKVRKPIRIYPATYTFSCKSSEGALLNSMIPNKILKSIDSLPTRDWNITILYNAYGTPSTAICEMIGTPVRAKIIVNLYHKPCKENVIIQAGTKIDRGNANGNFYAFFDLLHNLAGQYLLN